jgi:hypothetical protein
MDVEFTGYARMRMHQRDIQVDEVAQALNSPAGRHTPRKDGRYEVTQRIGVSPCWSVYRREHRRAIVINAMWEN